MILKDEKDFTVECEIDDEFTRRVANVTAEIFRTHHLEDNDALDPIGIVVEGVQLTVRYKKLS